MGHIPVSVYCAYKKLTNLKKKKPIPGPFELENCGNFHRWTKVQAVI
jgi:hypothetical protein